MGVMEYIEESFHGRNAHINNSKINKNLPKPQPIHINLEFESKKISNNPQAFLAPNSMGIAKI
jgi:hypothetical protein